MTNDVKYSRFLAALNIVCRNVRRVVDHHAGDDIRIDRQVSEVQQFFQAAQENRELFTADDLEFLDELVPDMLRGLSAARSESPTAAASEAHEERVAGEMHRCLRIPEIVQLIVSHLDPQYRTGKNQLALLARTRIFHEHALDILWSHQTRLAPLIKCMPDDLWEVNGQRSGTVLVFRRPVVGSDWDRLLYYSRRIRSLEIPSALTEDLSKVYRALLKSDIPGQYLLPNLRSLSCGSLYARKSIRPRHLALFLGPRISVLKCNTAHTSLFPEITGRFPALKAVTLERPYRGESNSDTGPEDRSISTFIGGLQSVERLETVSADLPALLHLGALTSLRTLKLYSIPAVSLSSLHDQDLFPNLVSVQLNAPLARPESAAEFIRSWTRPPVNSVGISLPEATAPLVDGILGALSEHCSQESFESLEISLSIGAQGEHGEILPGHALRSLTRFVNLVELTIETSHGYNLDDAFMAELASTWPEIEILRLKGERHNHLPTMTIASLYTLGEHCRYLRELELNFDALSVPRPATVTALHLRTRKRPVRLHNNLTSLNVAHSPISDALATARYLSIFCNLTDIQSDKEGWVEGEEGDETEQDLVEMKYSRLWVKVREYLPALTDVREEEFEWGCQSIELGQAHSFEFPGRVGR
ncbi:hypothetical protein FB45DRAFT_1053670 [Roridomyces roridus]|uniref:F-box domain-containing protein n=1 Tax=Roridomyces roridus TaxID=1738132 RepID=A0AAD7C746_9AGAR|nr:hypothetical protein FB45DRAFT_1053670 [Roridomyces roridus]